jgi:hypothetical protein
MTVKHPLAHTFYVASLAILVSACVQVSGEPDEPDPELASLMSGVTSADPSAAAGSVAADADEGALDGDAGEPARGQASDTGSACEADWECGTSAYCSRLSQRCRARCQGEMCIGPGFARDNDHLASDGQHVCFADDSDVPGAYALRIWDGSAAPATTLTRAMGARPLLLDGGYCYFHAAGALRRAPLNGGCVEVVQEMTAAPRRIWRDREYVTWQTADAEPRSYRVAQAQNARAEPAAVEAGGSAREQNDASGASSGTAAPEVVLLGGREIRKDARESRLLAIPRAGDVH